MKTAVITDSASYLDPTVANQYHIKVLPITIIFGTEQYRDGVDLTGHDFLEKLAQADQLPTTAQVTMRQMQTAFDDLSAAGYDEVICITLSSGITSFYQNLVAYSKTVTNIRVIPFDSKIASAGEADLALLAGTMAQNGETAKAILPRLLELRESIHVSLVVNSLDHLLRTGRISSPSAFVGNLLKIKPMLTFNADGQIVPLGKARTMKQALAKILDGIENSLDDFNDQVRISVADADNPRLSKQWVNAIKGRFPNAAISTYQISPAITVHTGEKAMGVVWDNDWEAM